MAAPYAHIACFVDDSDAAQRGLREAIRLRRLGPGRLSVVHVVAPPPWPVVVGTALGGLVDDPEALVGAAREFLEALLEDVPGAEAVVLYGHPAEEACDFLAAAGCDLAVAASHRGALARAFLGSFASYLAHHAPCPVLLVPPSAPEPGTGS
jgi:nucleotide-binding universal stress UspA family protein